MNSFEEKVLLGLKQCNIELKSSLKKIKLGIAVSGGADSVSLLLALFNIAKEYPLELKVITINHFIRPKEETCGDAEFVYNLCNQLSTDDFCIPCKVVELKEGQVSTLSKERKTGIEDAARKLRYDAFTQFIKEEKLDFLCLAHNLNDQLETLLMRFLQGSGVDHSGGIPLQRDQFIRPLLNISREEIETYLNERNQKYCNDSTNQDTKYLRNNIRNNLVPFLNTHFSGWKNSVINGGKKACEDGKIIENAVCSFLVDYPLKKTKDGILVELDNLKHCEKGIQSRVLLKAMNLAMENDADERVPFVFLNEILSLIDTQKNTFCKSYNQLEIIKKNNQLYIKKAIKLNTDLSFSVIIYKDGVYKLPIGTVEVNSVDENNHTLNINGQVLDCVFSYPVCLRNIENDDYILSANNSLKKVSVILKDWKVPAEKKEIIPVIQELSTKGQPLICILGKNLGFKDWIVRK